MFNRALQDYPGMYALTFKSLLGTAALVGVLRRRAEARLLASGTRSELTQ